MAALLAIGLAVRLWAVASEPLWLDEAYSAYAADHGFAFLWHVVPRYETHPPFYYALLHLWVLAFGDGVAALRLPGVIAGMATPPLAALAAREAGLLLGWAEERRRRLLLATIALASLAIPLVEMTRQVRPYPLMILAYAGAILLLLRLLRRAEAGARIGGGAFAAYLLLVEAMLWLHNMGPLYGVALTLALAAIVLRAGMTRADWAWLVGGHLLVALAYLPGLFILIDQAPTWVKTTWLRFTMDGLFADRIATLYAVPEWEGLAAVPLAGLALAALRAAPAGRRLAAALLILALLPLLLSIGLSLTVAPVFITRTMTPVAVPALLLLAIGAAAWDGAGRWLGWGALLILASNMLAADVRARAYGPMQDWYRTADWLARRFRPGDQVFAYPNEGALPLAYALRDKGLPYPIRAIPAPVPAFADYGGWYPTGSRGVVSLPPARLHAIAAEPATRAVPTIWLLRLGAETYDPGDVFLRALKRDRHPVRRWRDGPIDIIGLGRNQPSPSSERKLGSP